MTDLPVEERLAAHLWSRLGQWPPRAPLDIVGSVRRLEPEWDGVVRPVAGVRSPRGLLLSVPPAAADEARAAADHLGDWHDPRFADQLARLTGAATAAAAHVLDGSGLFRWSTSPAQVEPAGEWVDRADPRVPPWLRPFNHGGGVLVAWDDEGRYGAGVGLKVHDEYGWEVAVGTEPALRGRGLARRLVVTAAREVLRRGAVPTYLHEASNTASARVAEAAGFPDRGWRVVGLRRHPLA